ncbi:hypothetical protein WJX84_000779 [Apatococcus fuscideae]|uniref:aminodeoxychorismate synthase n=1 Tax=Apatococcus fuscideae TaxID=2026836 RepID=A0AAW1SYM8_9CHLO
MSLRTLLVDNYDSYTFNLFQLLATVNGVPPTVIKNNEWSWRQLQATIRDQTFDNIVISPGPGTPSNPNDIGVCKSLLASDLGVPILGVCMGCQALGLAHGATISRAPQAVHGKVSAVVHNGHALFHGITSGSEFEVVRYHSLQVDADSLPGCLEPLAWTSGAHHALQSAAPTMGIEPAHSANASAADQDGPVLMALAHRSLPRYGVQFHPESIGTPLGYQLLQNFASLTQAHLGLYDGSTPLPGIPLPRQPKHPSSQQQYSTDGAQASTAEKAYPGPEPSCGGAKPAASSKPLDVLWIHLPGALASVGSSNDLFWSLYGQHEAHDTFWLDSASRDRGRFSYMGGRGGPMWRRFTYRLPPVPCTPTPQASRGGLQPGTLEEAHAAPTPDAMLFLADRLIALDHHTGSEGPAHVQHVSPDIKEPTGESYEVCLTTALARCPAPDARILYPVLRALNPAPYAAWLSFGAQGPQICCSSPERFLKAGQDGWLEARPIKGTAKRHADDPEADQAAAQALVSSEKDRAENLMIVDLMRNDLGRVCQVGSVHVPGLMELESYATVHQLVSTVRGLRRPDASIADCLRATFPGGSMTGAPKIRTMEIIDKLEGSARGVYSGSVGFIGFNNAFDLNIVIRTAVCNQGQISIGAGGAIVVQSGVEDEYTEMRLKARALLAAVGACDDPCHRMPAVVNEDAVYC